MSPGMMVRYAASHEEAERKWQRVDPLQFVDVAAFRLLRLAGEADTFIARKARHAETITA